MAAVVVPALALVTASRTKQSLSSVSIVVNKVQQLVTKIAVESDPTSHCITSLKTADGLNVLKNQPGILEQWAEHLSTLLNQDSDADITILDELPEFPETVGFNPPPTLLGVLSAVRSLKKKSFGCDGIPSELYNQGG
ncbi:uncharacterized protein V6R79_016508 [Siganus canaliculatus]